MANSEHLDILKQGVRVWNQWKEEHIYEELDLQGADFYGSDLRGVNFSFVGSGPLSVIPLACLIQSIDRHMLL